MAIDAHSTTAPAFQRALLRDARLLTGSILAAATPVRTPDLTAETVALLDAIPPEFHDHLVKPATVADLADLPVPPLIDDAHHGGAGGVVSTVEETPTGHATARHMRRALESAIAHGIALLDALDAAGEDLEDGGDDEPSLGWIDGRPVLSDSHDDREAEADDEPMLGAPERSPYVESLGSPFYEPAAGGRLYRHNGDSQKSWAAGRNDAMNDGEAEPGYDLPEGDDERDGGSSGEPDNDGEAWLGAPENHDVDPDQEHWSQGEAGERGEDEPDRVQFLPFADREANAAAARDARVSAEAIRCRLRPGPTRPSRDELSPVLVLDGGNLVPVPGMFWWEGPAHG